jgi:threonine synthase
MTSLSTMDLLECARCNASYDPDEVRNLCTCGGPLLVHYDLAAAAKRIDPHILRDRSDSSLWRYGELLPVRDPTNIVSLGEGMTPLLPFERLAAEYGVRTVLTKDEGLNPTGTFKARGATTGVSRARELGIDVLAMPTNGNAGGAWASYGARAGMSVVLCMPVDAPPLSVVEAAATGAHVFMVRGQISDAGAMIAAAAKNSGWYEAATLKEPYRVEGKKTMGYEIAEQLGWRLPDVIIYPTGGGVGIIGLYKAFQEMRDLGWITDDFPRLIAVQAAGCAPIVRAFDDGASESQSWPNATTIAQGIRVPKALGDFLVLDAVRQTNGCCLAIDDEQTLAAWRTVAALEGAFVCPEGAAAYAAIPVLLQRGLIDQNESVVVLNTGTGLKYPDLMQVSPPTLDVGDEIPAMSAVG